MSGGKCGERSSLEITEYPGVNMVQKASFPTNPKAGGGSVCLSLPKMCYLQECCISESSQRKKKKKKMGEKTGMPMEKSPQKTSVFLNQYPFVEALVLNTASPIVD